MSIEQKSSLVLDNRRVHFRWRPQAGRPVVMLAHALSTNGKIWDFQLPLLRSRFGVLTFDLPGHGNSDPPSRPFSMADFAHLVVRLLDHLDLSQVALVGVSLGGMIAQQVAVEAPGRVAALVICSSGSKIEPAASQKLSERIEQVQARGLDSQVASTLTRWFTDGFRERNPVLMDWVGGQIRGTSADGFAAACRAIQGMSFCEQLPEIKAPVLVVSGELDQGFPPAAGKFTASQIPGAAQVVLPGLTHLSHVEAPHLFNETLLRFLDRVCS